MESVADIINNLMSRTPSEQTNYVFMTISINKYFNQHNMLINNELDKHVKYYIDNHLLSNFKISNYLLNNIFYQNYVNNKLSEIGDVVANDFIAAARHNEIIVGPEFSSNNTIYIFNPLNHSNKVSIIEYEFYGNLNGKVNKRREEYVYQLTNMHNSPGILHGMCNGSTRSCENNHKDISRYVANSIEVFMKFNNNYNYVSMKLYVKTYPNGMSSETTSYRTEIAAYINPSPHL